MRARDQAPGRRHGRQRRPAGAGALALGMSLGCAAAPAASAPPAGPTREPATPRAAQGPDIPFQLQLTRLRGANAPALQGMIAVPFEDKLVLMAGRSNGLHGFPGQDRATSNPSFPKPSANDRAYLVQQSTGEVLASASVRRLPASVVQQLTASNTEYTIAEGVLYVVGGYGYAATGDGMVTLEQVLAVSLSDLASAIQNDQLDAAFAKRSLYVGSHPALGVTGGSLQPASTIGQQGFLLIFGQSFSGVYSTGGGVATQIYNESVRQFTFTPGASGTASGSGVGQLSVSLVTINPPISRDRPVEATAQYHRRDLTVLPLLSPSGTPRIAALGGVFVPGQMAGFVHPVFIDGSVEPPGFTLGEDQAVTQWLSQYEAGAVPMYSASEKATYVTLFGGISQYYYAGGSLHHDTPNFNVSPAVDGLPFINSVSTLKLTASGSGQFVHLDAAFPPVGQEPECGSPAVKAPYLGAETVFVPRGDVLDQNGDIQLDSFSGPTPLGVLVGGIAATAPYPNDGTCASSGYYQVTLVPGTATPSARLLE